MLLRHLILLLWLELLLSLVDRVCVSLDRLVWWRTETWP
jgi:hypothetical protein